MKTKIPPRNILIGIWFALVVLMLTNFALAHFNLGIVGTAFNLVIAVIQMLLVLSFFMRLRENTKVVRVFAAAGYFWLTFLFALALSDYLTRQWH